MQPTLSRITLNPLVTTAALNEETVLLNLETGVYFGLDQIGTIIWSALAEQIDDRSLIVDRIVEAFDVDRQQVEGDVDAFLSSLRDNHLIDMHAGQ